MADPRERQVDRFIEGSLTPVQARELAQAALDSPELFEDLTYQAVAKAGLAGEADVLKPYISGKISQAGERQLAQAALENEELFDALVAHGAVEKSLQDPEFRETLTRPAEARAKVVKFPRKWRAVAIGSIAAAIALVGIYSWKALSPGRNAAPTVAVKVQPPVPSLDTAASGRAILLAADLRPNSSQTAPVFRSAETESRAPQPTGTVLSVEDGQVTVSLGSLDGLMKGAELDVFRGDDSKQAIGRLVVTTVFRDRARGQMAGGQAVEEKDRVAAQPAEYLAAVFQEMNRVDSSDKARALGRAAVVWAGSVAAPAKAERRVLTRLGALDYQAGDTEAAERDYQSAIASYGSPPSEPGAEQAAILNSLAVLYLLSGDNSQAEARLSEARANVADGTVYARTMNNLGVLAEMRGDTVNASAFYREALRALGSALETSPEDRKAVDANLARLGRGDDTKH